MPYLDRQNRICGFLDIEENENSGKFYRRYFILDALRNSLLWYMDNPQNLPEGANNVGSLRLSYISKVNEVSTKQKPKTEFCFVINALSRRYFLQANDAVDLKDWVIALNNATKITVPKIPAVTQSTDAATVISQTQATSRQAYKTEIVGGVVVHTPVQQNEADDVFIAEPASHVTLKSCQSLRPNVVRSGYCVKQGNVRKSWKRRFFILDEQHVSYYKNETDKDALRSIRLRDIQKVHECLVKSGELLSRDNLFEIITSTRTFYIQTDTPEEMNGWIKDIGSKIQDFRGPSKTQSYRFSGSGQGKPPLLKSCSVVQSWQPWTPVPKQTTPQKEEELRDSSFCSLPSLSRPGERLQSQVRQRHHSQPQPASKHTDFPMDTDVHVRTTDV
ncbi:pleckstrin homology domain-containing family A member 2 [Electrophorus electricus]|uniref:pleckstrin homology domain-containing family A member 2 n=1 Tax=Electrophorus electricus TaxID=8005 RepID=UPI0015CFA6FD|nr:pleckstrin homology domain-containing family A member 2 [Electrophorus electricus]XP_026865819.2 pleckstrin homology domain-containing family A member 2 [Electrophorus electricus]XP_026865820.2 pleckstrin homology domain-containing family A member 2 [Electrophorus electricus]XP_026865821.2 pleckstrin homology domain-containing family A member 2 [Electrophorus electricus]